MPTYKVLYAFTRLSDSPLASFGENISEQMTGNPGFTTPCVPLAALQTSVTQFRDAITAALAGGKLLTALKNEAREALIGLLRQQASYVQSLAGEDLSLLLSSGFDASSKNRAQIPLPKPVIELIDNPQSTQLGVRVSAVPTAKAYELRISYGTNGWQTVGVFTYSRPILVEGLTPGTIYTAQARAVGGSTGYSDWSDPVSHMAM